MKKTVLLLIPVLLIAAAFGVYYGGVGNRAGYADIDRHWARKEIEAVSAQGILTGSEGKFRPDAGVTLAEFCTVMTRLYDLPERAENTFEDINSEGWYADAVLRCVAAGIVDAEGKTKLAPAEPLTREEAFVMLARAMGLAPSEKRDLLYEFNDGKTVSPQAQGYLQALLEANIQEEHSGRQLYPANDITRAELACLLSDLLEQR